MSNTEALPRSADLHAGDCANCGAALGGPYCAQCGQHHHVEMPTLWEFVHEYLHHYVALEGKLGRTLGLLLCRPGRLSLEYLAGRRQRYVKPLQLYFTVSFLFFIALSFHGSTPPDEAGAGPRGQKYAAVSILQKQGELVVLNRAGSAPASAANAGGAEGLSFDFGFAAPAMRRWNAHLNARLAEFSADPMPALRKLGRQMLGYAPYGVFFLVPVFALFLWLLFYRRRLRYGAHLVFALHLHALSFLLFLLLLLLPLPSWGGFAGFCALTAYFVLAMRTMYGGRWRWLLARLGLLFSVYGLCAGLALLALTMLALSAA